MSGIVIVGGGIIGSSTAYYLALAGHAGDVVVIEPDPTYEHAATPRSTGGVRQLFSVPENIRMSQYGHEVYGDFENRMAVDGSPAPIDFRREGYMFLGNDADDARVLEANWRIQTAEGANVLLLDAAAVKRRFPSLYTDDITVAALSPDDGFLDPHSALQGFRRKAVSLGVRYIKDRVVGLIADRTKVTAVVLASGEQMACDKVVNAANCWAPEICAMVGLTIPVAPMRRMNFYFDCQDKLEPMPLTRQVRDGPSFRPEGAGYISGMTNYDEPFGFNWEVDYSWFEETIWPGLARRVKAFETIKLGRAWACHYDQNQLDGNAIIGPWLGGLENFYLACGFSGHGLQQAPAVGRALRELLIDGRFQSLDLSRFSYQRVIDNAPLADVGPVA